MTPPAFAQLAMWQGVALKLTEEFIRIRPDQEASREAIVLSLCARSFTSGSQRSAAARCSLSPAGVLVFFDRKTKVHRLKIIFGLLGLDAAELHGNMTMQQRLVCSSVLFLRCVDYISLPPTCIGLLPCIILFPTCSMADCWWQDALEDFKAARVPYLLATDIAARGLDITGVKTVINVEMPKVHQTYIHRVGRTARAARNGHAITLVPSACLVGQSVKRACVCAGR